MKRVLITLLLAAVAAVAVIAATTLSNGSEKYTEYLRIHVRANSNSAEDQAVKYEIKDEVVNYITPYVKECVTKERAMEVMKGLLPEIEKVCKAELKKRGYNYGARASVREEEFPTRVYGELTLEKGVYDALIIELGEGTGDNWWCVIYPPLCFTSASADVSYRSAIYEIIKKFTAKK